MYLLDRVPGNASVLQFPLLTAVRHNANQFIVDERNISIISIKDELILILLGVLLRRQRFACKECGRQRHAKSAEALLFVNMGDKVLNAKS